MGAHSARGQRRVVEVSEQVRHVVEGATSLGERVVADMARLLGGARAGFA
jgi:hypothetical protein